MYIETDYRLIMKKDRPDLSSERALQNNKPQLSKRKSQGEIKTGFGSQLGA
jgi:hypothetical protein